MKNKQVTCRPCKEKNDWEIQTPNGKVLQTHYKTKESCVNAGLKCAEEYGADLTIEDTNRHSI